MEVTGGQQFGYCADEEDWFDGDLDIQHYIRFKHKHDIYNYDELIQALLSKSVCCELWKSVISWTNIFFPLKCLNTRKSMERSRYFLGKMMQEFFFKHFPLFCFRASSPPFSYFCRHLSILFPCSDLQPPPPLLREDILRNIFPYK